MFDEKNIELDEKHSKEKKKEYLIRDDEGNIQFVYSIYRRPEMDIIFPQFTPVLSTGLLPVIDILDDKKVLTFEPNPIGSVITQSYFGKFIDDSVFAKEAAEYIMDHCEEL